MAHFSHQFHVLTNDRLSEALWYRQLSVIYLIGHIISYDHRLFYYVIDYFQSYIYIYIYICHNMTRDYSQPYVYMSLWLWKFSAVYSWKYAIILAWRHQAITWTNVDLSSLRSSDVHLRAIALEISQPSVTKIILKIIFLRCYWNLQGANELILW